MDHYQVKYKEKQPSETIAFIQSFLKELQIETEEEWISDNEIGTHSLRLSLKGAPGVGSNGKGMTKEYARASAYAEFMERLQNMRMTPTGMLTRIQQKNGGFFFHPSEKILTAEELVDANSSFMQMFFAKRSMQGASREERINELKRVQQFDYQALKEFGKFLCVPYYSLRTKTLCDIPYFISSFFYASNGMCAGNTPEEAIVQGISEIYERNANARVLSDYTALPDIPDEDIARFPDVYRMYQILKSNTKFHALVKDVSFGGQFPVAALILIENNTGKFGVKFGAHPNIGIALERIFTEATQGITLTEFSQKADLSFLNEHVDEKNNLINSFRTSNAQYPYQLMKEPPEYQYFAFEDSRDLTNKQLMDRELEKLLKQGYDVLIGDYSYSGFGSYHIIVPGLSEMSPTDTETYNKTLERFQMQYALGHPSVLTPKICRTLITHLTEATANVMENTLFYFSGLFSRYPYPGKEAYVDNFYLMIVCALWLGEYQFASEVSEYLVKYAEKVLNPLPPDYLMLRKYSDGMLVMKDHAAVIRYLRNMFDSELCDRYDALFGSGKNPVAEIYPEIWTDSAYTEEFRRYEAMILAFKAYQAAHPVNQMQTLSGII